MKRFYNLIIVGAVLLSLFACADKNATAKVETEAPATTEVVESKNDKVSSNDAIKYRVVKDRVIELTYDEFDFDKAAEYLKKYDNFKPGGCSAMKVILGDKVYVGRNYDFYCGDAPAFIVRNNAGKYRTIGIGNSPGSMDAWSDNFKIKEEVKTSIPYLCCDVMSEAGIHAETNVRTHEDGLECATTNPGAKRRCTQTFLQTMLSNYGSIDEILSHIDDYDWFDLTGMGFNQSFLLTDKNGRSVCIEFAKNSWKYMESDYNANYFLNEEYYAEEKYPIGEMRAKKLIEYKPKVKKKEDIFKMMNEVAYAQFYTKNVDVDYAMGEFLDDIGYTRFNLKENIEDARKKTNDLLEQYDKYTWEELVKNKCWESTFSLVADVTNKTLDVHFSEHYGIKFVVGFSDKIINIPADEKTNEHVKNADTTFRDTLWDDEELSVKSIEAHRGKCEGNDFEIPKTKNEVKKEKIASMDVLTLKKEDDYEKILLYIHGGGFILGTDKVHIKYVDELVSNCSVKAYMPLYKLIPDYTYKDTYKALLSLYNELLKEGKEIIIAGDSAGGNISLAFVEYLNEQNIKIPSKMMLHSPAVDFTLSNPEIDTYRNKEILLPKSWVKKVGEYWAGDKKIDDPLISPLYGNMDNMPKTIIFACTGEMLYPDIYKAYEKMRDAGNDVTLVSIENGEHVLSEEKDFKEGQESIKLSIDFCNDKLK